MMRFGERVGGRPERLTPRIVGRQRVSAIPSMADQGGHEQCLLPMRNHVRPRAACMYESVQRCLEVMIEAM
jgi:hypothetical protein